MAFDVRPPRTPAPLNQHKRVLVVGRLMGGNTVANTGSREYCSACRRILRTLDELDDGRCSKCTADVDTETSDSQLLWFDSKLRAFKRAAVDLAEAWEDVPGDVLGDNYNLDIDFSALASEIAGWGIKGD